jgi:hypothetical protein
LSFFSGVQRAKGRAGRIFSDRYGAKASLSLDAGKLLQQPAHFRTARFVSAGADRPRLILQRYA